MAGSASSGCSLPPIPNSEKKGDPKSCLLGKRMIGSLRKNGELVVGESGMKHAQVDGAVMMVNEGDIESVNRHPVGTSLRTRERCSCLASTLYAFDH